MIFEDNTAEHLEANSEFDLIKLAVSNMCAVLMEDVNRTSIEQCHGHLVELANIQSRFRQISGTKLENIPNIFITEEMTVQSVYDMYTEELGSNWIESVDTRCGMRTDNPVVMSMHALLELYIQWRLLEDALRSCLYLIGIDDRRQFSEMNLLSI
jgi:hypothetical protein